MSLERQDTLRADPSAPPPSEDSAPEDAPAPARLSPGSEVGRYKVRRVLGQGGMGVVYLAEDPQLGRLVALKLIRPGRGDGEVATEHQRRLLREAQVLARVTHPNLVTVYDVGAHDGGVFVAMEYVRGETLEAWLAEGARPWPEVLERFVAVGRGLVAAHDAGLVHRDFKPGNVMVASDGRVLLLDFGLARARQDPTAAESTKADGPIAEIAEDPPGDDGYVPAEDDAVGTDLTRAGGILGTPAYMAPEQHLALAADARADQFAFCVGLFEGLYGKRPFWGRDAIELMDATLRGLTELPPPVGDLPADVRRALFRGLQSDRDARFADMRELLTVLEHASGTAKPRRTGALLIAGAALVAITAVVTWRLAGGGDDDAAETTTTAAATDETGDGDSTGAGAELGELPSPTSGPQASPPPAGTSAALPDLIGLPPPAGSTGDTSEAPGADESTGADGSTGGPARALPTPDAETTGPGAATGGADLPGVADPDPLPPPPGDDDGADDVADAWEPPSIAPDPSADDPTTG